MKVLNLYSGIGGNRKLWTDCEVTAVEIDPDIAKVYKHFFPDDIVIVGDAHEYLLNHYNEFDFIWASPPCQSHSRMRQNMGVARGQNKPIYIDMKLYQEILFLQSNFKGKWIIENVIPYYTPLVKETSKIGRHLYWFNFFIERCDIVSNDKIEFGSITYWQKKHGFNLTGFKGKRKDQILKNCVTPEIGLFFFNSVLNKPTNNKRINKFNLRGTINNE